MAEKQVAETPKIRVATQTMVAITLTIQEREVKIKAAAPYRSDTLVVDDEGRVFGTGTVEIQKEREYAADPELRTLSPKVVELILKLIGVVE